MNNEEYAALAPATFPVLVLGSGLLLLLLLLPLLFLLNLPHSLQKAVLFYVS